ncbi:WD40-repeat-containing domain protein, partial [Boletus edulis]
KTIRVWNATTGQCVVASFEGHTDHVFSVACSPDGNHIVSGSWDKTIKVWRTQALLSFSNLYMENGWIQSSTGSYFGWVAPWSRHAFIPPIHSLVISSKNIYQLDVDPALFGESWISCWK